MNRRARQLVGFSVVAAATLSFVLLLGGHSGARRQLERYKRELRARGELLTFEELQAASPRGASRSPAPFLQAVAGLRSARFQPGSLNLRHYLGPGQAQAIWQQPDNALWQEFGAELADREGSLAELRVILEEPLPDWGPRTNVFSRTGPDFVAIRMAAQWLAGTALVRLREGRLEECLKNLEALVALARMNQSECTLVAQMIRIAVAGLGCAATWEALQSPGWNEAQLKALQGVWQSVDLEEAIERGFIGERVGGVELWSIMRQPNGSRALSAFMGRPSSGRRTTQEVLESIFSDYVRVPLYRMTSIDEDELFYLQFMQASLDSLRLLRAGEPWTQARRGFDRGLEELIQVDANSFQRWRHWLTLLALPNFTKALNTAVRAETERRLAVAAIALKRFELRNHSLPQTLNGLVPQFLAVLPLDPMSGQPLRYHRLEHDAFVLYSTGEDGQDDGGNAAGQTGSFGLWEGRDAVWPAVVDPAPEATQWFTK